MNAKVWFIGASLLVAAGTAFADDPNGGAGGDATGAGAAAGAGVAPAVTTPPAADAAMWSMQINDRPLVLPQGKFDVHVGVPIAITSAATSELLTVGGTFGVAPKIEAGADYSLRINPNADAQSGALTFHGAYAAMHSGKMDLAIAASLAVDFITVTAGMPPMSQTSTDLNLGLGAWFRYQVAPKFSIFSGNPGLPQSVAGLSSFIVPPLGYQLNIGLNNSGPVFLALPVGAGIQATPNLYAFVSTDLAVIKIANSSNAFIFSDFIPIGVGGFYSMDKLDVGVEFADDLKNAGDLYIVTVMARFFVK